jgi:hypothetical protein
MSNLILQFINWWLLGVSLEIAKKSASISFGGSWWKVISAFGSIVSFFSSRPFTFSELKKYPTNHCRKNVTTSKWCNFSHAACFHAISCNNSICKTIYLVFFCDNCQLGKPTIAKIVNTDNSTDNLSLLQLQIYLQSTSISITLQSS